MGRITKARGGPRGVRGQAGRRGGETRPWDACCRLDGTMEIAGVALALLKRSVLDVDARGLQKH